MFTIKSLKSGKNAVYVDNTQTGRFLVAAVLTANERLGDSVRIKPLSSGKIAMYLNNDQRGRGLVSKLFEASIQQMPYPLDATEDDDFDDLDFDDEEFLDFLDEDDISDDDLEDDTPLKKCSKCGEWKALDQFYRQKDGLHGRRGDCIECYKKKRSPQSKGDTAGSLSPYRISRGPDGTLYGMYNGKVTAKMTAPGTWETIKDGEFPY